MNNEQRVNIVGLVWIMMGIVSVGAVTSGELGLGLLIPLATAILTTLFLGVLPGMITSVQDQREKAKRSPQDRVAVLLELMDDDERAEFKAQLKQRILDDADRAQDGELPLGDTSLAALLHDDGSDSHTTRRS